MNRNFRFLATTRLYTILLVCLFVPAIASTQVLADATMLEETPLLGDVNQDNAINFLDIAPFVSVLSAGDFQKEADINKDDAVDFLDISPFISLLASINSNSRRQFSLLLGESNITATELPIRNCIIRSVGLENQELLALQHNNNPIENWITSVSPCVQGPNLISDLAALDARVAELGGFANIQFETIYVVQGESNSTSEAGKELWYDHANSWMHQIQSHVRENYGQQFKQIVVMVTRVEKSNVSTDSSRLWNEISFDLNECQKQFADSRTDTVYVQTNDLPRGDEVNLDSNGMTGQGLIVGERMCYAAATEENVTAGTGVIQNIFVYGDSFYATTNGIAANLDTLDSATVDYSGSVSGSTLQTIDSEIAADDVSNADLFILARGINDIAGGGDDLAQLQSDRAEAVAAVPHGLIILVTIPPGSNSSFWNATREATRQAYNTDCIAYAAARPDITLFDINTVLDADNDTILDLQYTRSSNDLHPNNAGYAAVAQELQNTINQLRSGITD